MNPNNGNGDKFSKLGPRAQLEAVKAKQPQVMMQVTINLMDNGQPMVQRPECHNAAEYAGVIDLIATALIMVAQKQGKATQDGFAAEFINLASTIKRLAMKQAGVEERLIAKAPATALQGLPPLQG